MPKKIPENLKKNCNNCEHLEWGFGDVNDPEGFMCNGRDYYNSYKSGDSHENMERHNDQLADEKYRARAKSCFSPKKEEK